MASPKNVRFSISLTLIMLFAAIAAFLFFPAISSKYIMYLDKVDEIPDIKQTDKLLQLPSEGRDYCAPVVVMDSFIQMKKHGFRQILLKEDESRRLPEGSCRQLAKLMNTRTGTGTTTEDFLNGLKRYIEELTPYSIRSLKYEGWNRHPAEFDNGHAVAELEWIKNGIRDNRCEWLNIGWYKRDAQSGELLRESGHWVCLTGYGMGADGGSNADTLIVRDPEPVLSPDPRKIFINVKALNENTIMRGPHEGLPRSCRGYLSIESMGNGFDSSHHRIGIIDGAIVLELKAQWLPAFFES